MLTAWCIQGGAVRAGYVTVAAISGEAAGQGLLTPALMPLEQDAGTSMAYAGDSTWQRPDASDSRNPANPSCPFATPLHPVYNFGLGSDAGSSSSSGSGNGPSTPPAGLVSRLQVPTLELASLLPPETGDAHSFSVASFLFRPPRVS